MSPRAEHARQSLYFQKNTGTLKINPFLIICRYLPCTVHQRTLTQKKIFEIIYFQIFHFRPQNGQRKHPGAGTKKFFIFIFFAHFKVKKHQFYVKFWNWGSITIWHNMTCWKCRHFLGVCCLCWGA